MHLACWYDGAINPTQVTGSSALSQAPENRHTYLFLFEDESTVIRGWGRGGPPGAWAGGGHKIRSHLGTQRTP